MTRFLDPRPREGPLDESGEVNLLNPIYRWPPYDAEIAALLNEMGADGSWGHYSGTQGARLREALEEMHGRQHVRLTSSGTVAVELALRGVGVQAGDEVILAAYDFAGNFRCIERIGARPVLVDVSPHTLALDNTQLDMAHSPSVRAVLVSHLHSGLAPMSEICHWAEQQGVTVVEDACQAPGAWVDGRIAGAWGSASVLSFGGSKLLTAGRGGAVLTEDAICMQRMKVYAEGGNDAYPLSELQSAVLIPQLDKLASRNRRRRKAVARLVGEFGESPCWEFLGDPTALDGPSYFKVAWNWHRQTNHGSRNEFLAVAQSRGLPMDAGFRGFARRGQRRCRRVGDLPHARQWAESLIVMHHPWLISDETLFESGIGALRDVLAQFS